ncbi:MAG: glycosyltransferase [Bacteroidota bacterium]
MQQPLLSVALPVYNQHDQIESTLTALYECSQVPMEVILIDDASTDDSQEVIHSVLDYYQHERTFFFEHAQHWGRGNTLNEALQQISAPYFWIPGDVEEIQESALLEALDGLSKQPATGAYLGFDPLPKSVEQWLGMLEADVLPTDDLFLWQLPQVPMHQLFFNPYLAAHHGAELALRLQHQRELNQADPFFTLSQEAPLPQPDRVLVSEFVYSMLRRPHLTADEQQQLLGVLHAFHEDSEVISDQLSELDLDVDSDQPLDLDALFAEAQEYHQNGQISVALEILTLILNENDSHEPARQLKIQLLERQRRYVEASELKHQQREQRPPVTPDPEEPELTSITPEPEASEPEDSPTSESVEEPAPSPEPEETEDEAEIRTSIIIPTTADSKPLLEACLVHLSKHADPATTELIIVDNASLDDTFEYLEQLKEQHFFHVQVLTHSKNVGFARSINEGIARAQGRYLCAMHTDVMLDDDVPGQLADLLDRDEDHVVGLIAPLAANALNPQQEAEGPAEDDELVEVDFVDSFMMMWRADMGLTFDEQFGAAYFEDVDFGLQVQQHGMRIAVAPGLWVDHYERTITKELGLSPNGRLYWENAARFNAKWEIHTEFPNVEPSTKEWEKLCILGELMNPYAPEPEYLDLFDQWFTSEAKTQMLKPERSVDEQVALMQLMISVDQRDTLRELEDIVDQEALPIGLIQRLVDYYFDRHIYSRCKLYLDLVPREERPLNLYISELKIAVKEREMSHAIELLSALMDEAPVHPELLELAGEIHHFKGNTEQAAEFYDLSQQVYPNSLRPKAERVQNDYVV